MDGFSTCRTCTSLLDDTPLVLPYRKGTDEVVRLHSLEQIQMFDAQLSRVTEGLPLPIRLGSILRITSSRYGQFGIELTPENRACLQTLAQSSYLQDAEEARGEKLESNPWYVFKKGLSEQLLGNMATVIGSLIQELLSARLAGEGQRPYRVLDLACGTGRASAAIATALVTVPETRRMVTDVEFNLVDHSGRLFQAQQSLRMFGIGTVPHLADDEAFLREAVERGQKFDVIVSVGHFHRKPFLPEYMRLVSEALAENGILAVGDFHSTMTHHPVNTYRLLQRWGIESWRLDLFSELMGPLIRPGSCNLLPCEVEAVNAHIRYWDQVAAESTRCETGGIKLRIFGGFVSSKQLANEMDQQGITTDREKIQMAFPGANLPRHMPYKLTSNADTAVVTLGMKRVRA